MRILTESQYQIEAKSSFQDVFVNSDAFDRPFSPLIIGRVILYPCEIYLYHALLNGLVSAASTLGDTGCYLKKAWQEPKQANCFFVPLSELIEVYEETFCINTLNKPKLNLDFWIDYFLYSATGSWGLMVSHERYGLLGGTSKFINKVREFVPNLDNQVYIFLKKLQSLNQCGFGGITLDWVSELFTNVYGQEIAEKMLKEYELL